MTMDLKCKKPGESKSTATCETRGSENFAFTTLSLVVIRGGGTPIISG